MKNTKQVCPYCKERLKQEKMENGDYGSYWFCVNHLQFEFWIKPAKFRRKNASIK